jgi:uncharacterized membrane protein
MVMRPGLRRVALTVHVLCSVGWIGAAAAYLALGIAAQTSNRAPTVRAAWTAMGITGWYVIVPLGVAAFLTGLLMSVGTRWGLIRHYWVLIALILTSFSLVVLILHMPSVTASAMQAADADDATAIQLEGDILHPAGGIAILLVVAVLNIYKPRGLTRYGQRRAEDGQHPAARRPTRPARNQPPLVPRRFTP